jgi:hypothetical protein
MDAAGEWSRAPLTIDKASALVTLRASSAPILGVRFAWEGYPQCALYNGAGGPDNHTAVAARPFQWCAYGTSTGAGAWAASCSTHDPSDVAYPSVLVPSSDVGDFTASGGASGANGPSDAACSGANLRSGNPGGRGVLTSRHAVVGDGHVLDGVSLAFRWIAGYDINATHPSNLTVALTNSSGAVVATLYRSGPLSGYPYAPFTSYSPPLKVEATGLGVRLGAGARVFVAVLVDNNDRNLQLALDDKVGGWNVTLAWA